MKYRLKHITSTKGVSWYSCCRSSLPLDMLQELHKSQVWRGKS